ncbi:MAG: hypothetical protein ACI8XD_000576 [Thermoproteota archaeon]
MGTDEVLLAHCHRLQRWLGAPAQLDGLGGFHETIRLTIAPPGENISLAPTTLLLAKTEVTVGGEWAYRRLPEALCAVWDG